VKWLIQQIYCIFYGIYLECLFIPTVSCAYQLIFMYTYEDYVTFYMRSHRWVTYSY